MTRESRPGVNHKTHIVGSNGLSGRVSLLPRRSNAISFEFKAKMLKSFKQKGIDRTVQSSFKISDMLLREIED